MESYYETKLGELHLSDNLSVLKQLPDNSVDSMITDPPAGIAFLGKDWDKDKGGRDQWIAWLTEIMTECYRVLKPGATSLVWAIPRTSHWTSMALENSGFFVKDKVYHIFGTGFPKSTNISKQLDKKAGAERERTITKISERFKKFKEQDGCERKTFGEISNIPITDEAKQWDGWCGSLKPAVEEWILCMKPNDGTYANNAIKHGVAGLNIDGSRIGTTENTLRDTTGHRFKGLYNNGEVDQVKRNITGGHSKGRWPANLILSCTCEELIEVPDKVTQATALKEGCSSFFGTGKGLLKASVPTKAFIHTDPNCPCYQLDQQAEDSVSRFFYCAKPSKAEKNAGCDALGFTRSADRNKTDGVGGDNPRNRSNTTKQNHHPTVKPLKLMKYLCNLTKTPTGGKVLDPFAGSGTTLLACEQIGRQWIGIEISEKYCEIAAKRIKSEISQSKMFV